MVEVAKQAFTTNNFDLAVDVYERIILENGPNLQLYLGLADSFARAGHISKSFDAYIKAFRLGRVNPENLEHLVASLITIMVDNIGSKDSELLKKFKDNPFSCGSCRSLCCEPVTVQCGHTFCRKCLDNQDDKCPVCKQTRYSCRFSEFKPNVLLSKTIESWFHDEAHAGRMKVKGNQLFEQGQYLDAIDVYTQAFKLAPNDHLISSNMSYAYLNLGMYKEALEGAEHCIKVKPDWPKGYFRKAAALSKMSKNEDAAIAYLQCLSIDSSVTSARSALACTLHKLLSIPEAVKHSEHKTSISNPLIRALRSGNYPNDEQPYLDSSLLQLRLSVREAVGQSDRAHSSGAAENNVVSVPCTNSLSTSREGTIDTSHNLRKCSSDPCLSKCTTPTTGNSSTSSSLTCQDAPSISSEKLSRKRSKREALLTPPEPASPTENPPKFAKSEIKYVLPETLNKDDFECTLCFRLLFHPVTTPCGHSFCRSCLDRSLDHTAACPLCKSSLVKYLAERRSAITESIEKILQLYFAEEYAIREKIHEEEMAKLAQTATSENSFIPLFVCTIAYPRVPCPLHVFEPRYRLMIRQSMESGTRQFGMITCFEDDERKHADYGTMLEIRDVQYFPDGRSVVDCVGGRRFKVIERGQKDGYNTARVEFLKDRTVPEENIQEIQRLHDEVFQIAKAWFESLSSLPKQRIVSNFGQLPSAEMNSITLPNGPAWHWWLTAVLPLDPRAQLSLVSMTNLKNRLIALNKMLDYLRTHRSISE